MRRKDESGLMFNRALVRRYEDSCRRDVALKLNRHWLLPDRRSRAGLRNNLNSIRMVVCESRASETEMLSFSEF